MPTNLIPSTLRTRFANAKPCLVWALVAAAFCVADSGNVRADESTETADTKTRTVREILSPYTDAVWTAYRDGAVNAPKDAQHFAALIAQEHVPQVADELHAASAAAYLELPVFEIDETKHQLVDTEEIDIAQQLLKDTRIATPGFLIVMLHAPDQAAMLARRQTQSKNFGVSKFGAMMVLEGVAPPRQYRGNDDPQKPVIVFAAGNEAWAIDLSFNKAANYYLPVTQRHYEIK